MYIAGEATSTTTSVFTIGKLVGGSATGSSDTAGSQRATKHELFRITNVGNVGIGTDDPGQELEVFGDDFTGIRIKSSRTGLTEQIGGVGFSTSSDQVATINALVDGTVIVKNTTSDTERLRITGVGTVRIPDNGKFTAEI